MDYNILIPTFNRPQHLKRILSYYAQFGQNCNITIADSSLDDYKKLNREIVSSIINLNIRYLDIYSSDINICYKIADALNYVKEEYCVFCADDDFIVPDSIGQSMVFLENNKDFAVAHGYYIAFYLSIDSKGNQTFSWQPRYSYESNIFSNSEDRLFKHLSNYSLPTIYGVHKTNLLRMIFKDSAEFADGCRFSELLPSVLALIHGKMKCLNTLHGARDMRITKNYQPSFQDLIRDGTYGRRYEKFRQCLINHLGKTSRLSMHDSKMVINKAMSKYLSMCSGKKNLFNKINLKALRYIYRKLFVPCSVHRDNFMDSLDIPSSMCYEDFNRIRMHVLRYNCIG